MQQSTMTAKTGWRAKASRFCLTTVVLAAGCDDDTVENRYTYPAVANTPPVAQLLATPLSGRAPLRVYLNAMGSTDPDQDSATLKVRWDFEGDLTWDTELNSANQLYETTYTTPGNYSVRVEVADRKGARTTGTLAEPIRVLDANTPLADLSVDSNRDGAITAMDDEGEESWSSTKGAVVLVNWDDDDGDGDKDNSDTAINGNRDVDDLTHLIVRRIAALDSNHTVTLEVGPSSARPNLRIFNDAGAVVVAPGIGSGTLSNLSLSTDASFYVEGVGGRSESWEGQITLTLRIADASVTVSEDVVAMRIAPVIFPDNAQPSTAIDIMRIQRFANGPNGPFYDATVANLPSGVALRVANEDTYDADRWIQDNMQAGYQAAPSPTGMRILPTYLQTERSFGEGFPAGLESYLPDMLGPDFAFNYPCAEGCYGTSLDYGGNIEVAPTHTGYPLGRLVIGGGDQGTLFGTESWHYHMDETQRSWLNAQGVQAPALEVSSEWLAVGHIDEFFLFVPDYREGAERPWKIIIASTTLALQALQTVYDAGQGQLPVFDGRETETTVAHILANSDLMTYNQLAQARIDAQRVKLSDALGLTAIDFIDVPVIYEEFVDYDYGGTELGVAYNPGITNLLVVDDVFFVPDPEGPRPGGNDVWQAQTTAALAPLGVDIVFVDVFDSYHLLMGEAHCGTNVQGNAYDTPWWQL